MTFLRSLLLFHLGKKTTVLPASSTGSDVRYISNYENVELNKQHKGYLATFLEPDHYKKFQV